MKEPLRIGLYSRMILEFPPARERMNCRFIGLMPDEFVAVRVPLAPGVRERFGEGAVIDFRYLHEGSLMGFRTEVILYQATPFSIAFVRYPDRIERHDLRKEKRLRCRFATTVTKNEDAWKGVTVDISEGGCRFLLDASVEEAPEVAEGDFVSGSIMPIGAEKPFPFKARVAGNGVENGRYFLGLVFQDSGSVPPRAIYDSLKQIAEMLDD